MPLVPQETHLTDLEGAQHRYETVPLAFDEAFDLGLELADMIGGPLGAGLRGMLDGQLDIDTDIMDLELGDLFAAFGSLPQRLLAKGGSKLLARIMATTYRVVEGPAGKQVKQRLSDAQARTEAWAGGNMWEAMQAVKWVLGVNYGPFLTGLSSAIRERLPMLMSYMSSSNPEPAAMMASESDDSNRPPGPAESG